MLVTAGMAFALLQTMIIPALPALRREFDAGAGSVLWVMTVFLITASLATPVFGRLGDMLGKDRVLVLVLALFGFGSLLCALAPSLPLLVAGRAVQGTGGAIFPLAFGIIRDEFPRETVTIGIGLMSAIHGAGGAAGLVLSGLIVDHLDYTWIFWLGLIVTVPAIAATALFVPASPVRAPTGVDWRGTLRVLRAPTVWMVNTLAFVLGFGLLSSLLLLPQLVQLPAASGFGFGGTATQAGLYLVPQSLAIVIAAPVTGWIGSRIGSRVPLLIGIAVGVVAFVQILFWHSAPWHVWVHGILNGWAVGMSFAAMVNLIVGAVPPTHTGVATGTNMILRSLGGAVQTQVCGVLLAVTALSETGFELAFGLSAALMAAAFVLALRVPQPPRLVVRGEVGALAALAAEVDPRPVDVRVDGLVGSEDLHAADRVDR